MDQSQRLPHARSSVTRVITLNIAQSTKGYQTKNSIFKIFTFNKTSVCGICGVQHDVFHGCSAQPRVIEVASVIELSVASGRGPAGLFIKFTLPGHRKV